MGNAAENAAWHKAAAEIVGAPYKKEKPLIDPAKLAAAEAAVLPPKKKKAIKKLSLHQSIGKLITEAKQDASKAVAEATQEGTGVEAGRDGDQEESGGFGSSTEFVQEASPD